jgi:3-dehydroquinate dehydratase-1
MSQPTGKIGSVTLGPTPRVVGTLSTAAGLQEFDAQQTACDIVEVRLDRIGAETTDWLTQCRAISMPAILTIRLAAEGGEWRRPEAERKHLFAQALENFPAVDVELQSALLPELTEKARKHGRAVIVSFHDFNRTPPVEELSRIATDAVKFASVVKIATMITDEADVEALKTLLARGCGVPLCVIGMGPMGTASRTLFPKLGSCLAYGYLDVPAAPGQLSAEQLLEQLRS